jgi:hypothetical protein
MKTFKLFTVYRCLEMYTDTFVVILFKQLLDLIIMTGDKGLDISGRGGGGAGWE